MSVGNSSWTHQLCSTFRDGSWGLLLTPIIHHTVHQPAAPAPPDWRRRRRPVTGSTRWRPSESCCQGCTWRLLSCPVTPSLMKSECPVHAHFVMHENQMLHSLCSSYCSCVIILWHLLVDSQSSVFVRAASNASLVFKAFSQSLGLPNTKVLFLLPVMPLLNNLWSYLFCPHLY